VSHWCQAYIQILFKCSSSSHLATDPGSQFIVMISASPVFWIYFREREREMFRSTNI
jgi:hypothetical protein